MASEVICFNVLRFIRSSRLLLTPSSSSAIASKLTPEQGQKLVDAVVPTGYVGRSFGHARTASIVR